MWLPDTGCPGPKMTSRSSPDVFLARNRIKTVGVIRWFDENCVEWLKHHKKTPPTIQTGYVFNRLNCLSIQTLEKSNFGVSGPGPPKNRV